MAVLFCCFKYHSRTKQRIWQIQQKTIDVFVYIVHVRSETKENIKFLDEKS